MELLITLGIVGVVGVFALVILGFIISRMYNKSTPEMALIRTGGRGPRVITNGGILVIGMIHEITKVNMKTLGLEVVRQFDDALITKDRMRVDVGVKFFVRVKPGDEDAIKIAAQTLGEEKLGDPTALRPMVEDKLVDALRAAAAKMTMDQLHENREQFVQDVQNALKSDLDKNGLELESVSLTQMDQTPMDKLDENNAFNAVGMQKLAEVIAESKKRRATIDADAAVRVAEAERDAETQKFAIEQDVEEQRIAKEQAISEAASASQAIRTKALEAASQQEEEARIGREQAVAVADQEKKIAVNTKSMEESEAKAKADEARAKAKEAEEAVITAGHVAAADRQKRIAIIDAEQVAEKDATRIRVAASAEKAAAEDRAAARLIEADALAKASTKEAEAQLALATAEAEGIAKKVDAENTLSSALIDMKIDMQRLEILPSVVAQMVKPAESVDSITLHHVTGLGSSGGGAANASAPTGGAAGGITDALMEMAVKYPALKALGEEAGINIGGNFGDVLSGVMPGVPMSAVDVNDPLSDLTMNDIAFDADRLPPSEPLIDKRDHASDHGFVNTGGVVTE